MTVIDKEISKTLGLRRNRKGDLIIFVQPEVIGHHLAHGLRRSMSRLILKPLYWGMHWGFEQSLSISWQRSVMLIMMVLGLSFGFTVAVTKSPVLVVAQPPTPVVVSAGIHPAAISLQTRTETLTSDDLVSPIVTTTPPSSRISPVLPIKETPSLWQFLQFPQVTIAYEPTTGSLTESSPVMIGVGFRSELSGPIQSMSLGDTITVTGTNNGRYTYTVVEIKTISREELNELSAHHTAQVIVITPTSLIGSHLVAVIGT